MWVRSRSLEELSMSTRIRQAWQVALAIAPIAIMALVSVAQKRWGP